MTFVQDILYMILDISYRVSINPLFKDIRKEY